MKSVSCFRFVLFVICLYTSLSSAATIAHWTMADAGASDGAYMPGNGERTDIDADGAMDTDDFRISSVDLSGNSNHLTAWSSSWMKWTADSYKGDFGMQATNSNPACGTDSFYNPDSGINGGGGIDAETIEPAQWTVECVFKATADTNRTMVGRDGYGVRTSDARTAPLYLAERSSQRINCEFVDVTGDYHNATSANGTLVAGNWYHVAAVSNGTTLTLYLKDSAASTDYNVVATANLSASANSALALGYGTWSVSRGMWNNNHTDRFMGIIDEVAISDTALTPSQFVIHDSVILTETNGSTVIQTGGQGSTDTYQIQLAVQPTASVVITADPPVELNLGAGAGAPVQFTFTTSDWDQPQTITVAAANPQTSQELSAYIQHTSASSDSNFNAIFIKNIYVHVLPAECGSLGYLEGDYNLDCFVNLLDFSLLAQVWLETDVPLELNEVASDWLKSSMIGESGAVVGPIKKSTQPFAVNTANVLNTIDEKIYGHFLEHIYHSANGGLWGELVWNRSFETSGSSGGGIWSIEGNELVQSSLSADVHTEFGDTAWTDYELTLQAQKTGGNEGFLILFRAPNSDNFYWLNLGGWNNTLHAIEKEVNGGRSVVTSQVSGSITTGQWYDIRVLCEGNHFQVWLDENPVFDYTDTGSAFLTGNVGVGTWSTQARFRNIQVTNLSGSTVLFSGLPTLEGNPFGAGFWTAFGTGTALMSTDAKNDDYSVQITGDGSAAGLQQDDFKFIQQAYQGSLWMKGTLPAGIKVELLDGTTVLGQAILSAPTADWAKYPFQITPSEATDNGSLRITLLGAGTVTIDQVSLMGQDAIDVGGYRPDLLEAVAELRPPVIRWPGGCFASAYFWKDGIGPQEDRVKYPISLWDDQDTNSYGTDEFLRMCEAMGTEALICVNTGLLTGTCGVTIPYRLTAEQYLQDALDWMEYCNGSTSTTWGAVRAANGHPAPYNVKYWEIDNETWSEGYGGGSANYIAKVLAFAPAMRAKAAELGVAIEISAVGSGGFDQSWNQSIINNCATLIDYISVHYYEDPANFKSAPLSYENYIINLANIIAGSDNPDMKIYNSEWNAQSTDWRTGLFAGGILNTYERQGNVFKIGGPALFLRHTSATGWDNSFINFDHTGWFAAPNYIVMKLWHDHYAPNRLETTGTDTNLNVVSTLSDDARTLYIQIVNADSTDKSVAFEIDSSFIAETAYMHYAAPGDLYARNTLANPNAVYVQAKVIGLDNQMLRFIMPAYSAGVVTVQTTQPQTTKYLYSYFQGNGDGLHLAYSTNGLTWTDLNGDATLITPTIGSDLMRDPSICQGPDGMFHMVWTTGWNDNGIGIAHSADLINWSAQTYLPVMADRPYVYNCWAPEIFYDDVTGKYLIFWASTLTQGSTNDHRIYYITTEDFATYTDTALFYDPGFSCIDAFIAKDGDRYVMVLKDERDSGKNIRITFSDHAEGPYGTPPSASITPSGLWVEGPSMVKVGQEWVLYYDAYTSGYMGGQSSTDLGTWTDIRSQISFPSGTRHGTVFTVPNEVLIGLQILP
jgi:alpha-N-arabinofuranosidase